jgi:hypothetical protein
MAELLNVKPAEAPANLGSRYVRGEQLLEALFEPTIRPSLRWLRAQQAARALPFVKVGRLVFFDPIAVKLHWESKRTIKARTA